MQRVPFAIHTVVPAGTKSVMKVYRTDVYHFFLLVIFLLRHSAFGCVRTGQPLNSGVGHLQYFVFPMHQAENKKLLYHIAQSPHKWKKDR